MDLFKLYVVEIHTSDHACHIQQIEDMIQVNFDRLCKKRERSSGEWLPVAVVRTHAEAVKVAELVRNKLEAQEGATEGVNSTDSSSTPRSEND